MCGETLRQGFMNPDDVVQDVLGDGGGSADVALGRVLRHRRDRRAGGVGITHLGEHRLQTAAELLHHGLGVLGGDVATADEALGVELACGTFLVDELVHVWLGEAGVITLVVTPQPVAHQIDGDVTVERLAIVEGELRSLDDGSRIIPVDVDHRGINGLEDVGAVGGAATLVRSRGEPHLVVDDDVNRATGAVTLQPAHLKRLVDDPLPGECRVPVQQYGHDREVLRIAQAVELGTYDSLQHRVDGLEVAGVGGDRGTNAFPGVGLELTFVAQVVLDVTGPLGVDELGIALELPEDLAVGLADDVGQHIEATTVRHAYADLVEVLRGGHRAQPGEQDDRGFRSFEAEPLLADVLGLQEGLEDLRLVELVEDAQVGLTVQRGVFLLAAFLEPSAYLVVVDVHVLDAHVTGIGVTQNGEDLTQGEGVAVHAGEIVHREDAIQVPQGESVTVEHDVVVEPWPVLHGVGVGDEVAESTPGIDEFDDTRLLVDLVGTIRQPIGGPLHRGVGDAQ